MLYSVFSDMNASPRVVVERRGPCLKLSSHSSLFSVVCAPLSVFLLSSLLRVVEFAPLCQIFLISCTSLLTPPVLK